MEDNPTTKAQPTGRAKGYANLKPNPQHLKRGGKKPRKHLTAQELRFCAHYAKVGSVVKAAVYAGIKHPYDGYPMMERPIIKEQITKEQKRNEALIQAKLDREFEIDIPVVDAAMINILLNGKHEVARAKIGHSVYQRLGLIKPVSVSANSSSSVTSAATQIDIYKPAWLREREAKLAGELEAKYGAVALQLAAGSKPLTQEQALIYMNQASGDRDRARELARSDGYTF